MAAATAPHIDLYTFAKRGTLTKTWHFVFALALANAILYCCALPLWEGFDEPFHYGYLETVAVQQRLPVFGKAMLSAEIHQSLLLVPLSHFLSRQIPGAVSFEDYSKLPRDEQLRMRRGLHDLSPTLRRKPSALVNYEAQHAPLAYLVLAPFDVLLSSLSVASRILWLRLIGALGATALLCVGLRKLTGLVAIDISIEPAMLLCMFTSQMLWASVAHVGNDWLAVPLTLCFLTWLAAAGARYQRRDVLFLAVIFAAGLLTKAYFLAFTPAFAAVIFWHGARAHFRWRTATLALAIPIVLAGPWYGRNMFVSGSFIGTQQAIAGVGPMQAIAALPHVPWLTSVPNFLRWSLWTGNWSFVSFSQATLNAELALLCFALLLYAYRYPRISAPERWVLVGCACLIAGLTYQTCVTWASSHGESTFAEPWYWQGIIPCFWVLSFLGLQRSALSGRIGATLLCLLSAWIAALTYVAKMLPGYASGFGRGTLRGVADWWLSDTTRQDLQTVSLAPSAVVYAALATFLLLLAYVTPVAIHRIWTSQRVG